MNRQLASESVNHMSSAEHDRVDSLGLLCSDQVSLVLPVIAEKVVIQRHSRITGRVRISKGVQEREEVIDEPLLRRTVHVEHVPINRVVEGEIPVRYEGDTMIIPILEEVLVVEKRLILKEELHITQRQDEIRQPQRIILRSEDITIERIVPNGEPAEEA
jgi:stress response protein YsnF